MPSLPDLIRLLDDPDDDEAYDRAFGEPEPIDLDDGLLPHPDDQPFLFRELLCNLLAEQGVDAIEAVPALVRCSEDLTDSTLSRFMQLAAVTAIWKITSDPAIDILICERLLLDKECWFRRYVVELLEEIGSSALPALRGRLVDDRYEVRERARKAIERIEGGLM